MADQAHVRSVERIEDFRSRLIVYLAKLRPLLEEVGTDLQRMKIWLETDQREHCEREVRRRTRALEEAQQSLLSARMSTFREASAFEQAAVHKARRAKDEAEEKLRAVKRWARDFEARTQAVGKPLGSMETFIGHDMARAVAWLTERVRQLEAYADVSSQPFASKTDPNLSPPASLEPEPAVTVEDPPQRDEVKTS